MQPEEYIRQGDVVVTMISEAEADEIEARETGQGRYPETMTDEPYEHSGETGRKHTVRGKGMKRSKHSTVRKDGTPGHLIRAPEGAEVEHAEHGKTALPKGSYVARPVREMADAPRGGID